MPESGPERAGERDRKALHFINTQSTPALLFAREPSRGLKISAMGAFDVSQARSAPALSVAMDTQAAV